MIPKSKLDKWIEADMNVLLCGEAGVGKTYQILESWIRHGLNFKVFSAATMDPWVDFIGVPKEVVKDGKPVLGLIRPEEWANDTVEALFIDEFNRAPKKVRNAVMELIQFKSINGHKFNNLRFVWAAINPDDSEDNDYDVEPLDPAQKDRFQVYYEVPYSLNLDFFTERFGGEVTEKTSIWWNNLAASVRKLVSPRRVEYALDAYLNKGVDVEDILPKASGPVLLKKALAEISVDAVLVKFMSENDKAGASEWLSESNNYSKAINSILINPSRIGFFLETLPDERISALIATNLDVRNFAINMAKNKSCERVVEVINAILDAGENDLLIKELRSGININKIKKHSFDKKNISKIIKNDSYKKRDYHSDISVYREALKVLGQYNLDSFTGRKQYIAKMHNSLPAKLSGQDLESGFNALEAYLESVQAVDYKFIPFLIDIGNHLIFNAENDGYNFKKIVGKWEIVINQLLDKEGFYYRIQL